MIRRFKITSNCWPKTIGLWA